jgi:hypothetical protein
MEPWAYMQSDTYDYDNYGIKVKTYDVYFGHPENMTGISPSKELLMRIYDEDGIYNFEYYSRNKMVYPVPAFVPLHLNLIKTYENYADFANRVFAVISFCYGVGELFTAGKLFWGLVNVIYNGSTIFTGQDAITNIKNIALNNIKLKNPENQDRLKESLNLLCTFLSLGLNSRNVKKTMINGVSLSSAAGDIANAYSEVMMFLPEEEKKQINDIVNAYARVINYDYIPY